MCLNVLPSLDAADLAVFFFFNDTATTEIYTLSLHDALPIFRVDLIIGQGPGARIHPFQLGHFTLIGATTRRLTRSEEHTSELQSPCNIVCRLLLEKKNLHAMYNIHRQTRVDVRGRRAAPTRS